MVSFLPVTQDTRSFSKRFRAQVEKRFSHSDQRMESIRDFCSARLESINESCSSLEKDLSKLKETFRDEQKVQRS